MALSENGFEMASIAAIRAGLFAKSHFLEMKMSAANVVAENVTSGRGTKKGGPFMNPPWKLYDAI